LHQSLKYSYLYKNFKVQVRQSRKKSRNRHAGPRIRYGAGPIRDQPEWRKREFFNFLRVHQG